MFQMKFYGGRVLLAVAGACCPTRPAAHLTWRTASWLDYSPDESRAVALRGKPLTGDPGGQFNLQGATGDFQATAVADVRLVPAPRALPDLRRHARPPYPGWPDKPWDGGGRTPCCSTETEAGRLSGHALLQRRHLLHAIVGISSQTVG